MFKSKLRLMYQGSIINHKWLWSYGINFHSPTRKKLYR